MKTEYSNERKQWEPIPEPLLGALVPAIFSRLRFHFCERTYYFIEKKNYQAYEKLFLLFLVSVQFSFRRKHILSFSKNKNRSQKPNAKKNKQTNKQTKNQRANS